MASKRRGNREGQVYKRADGRWEARVRLPDGGRKSFYAKTRKEAAQKLHNALRDVGFSLPLADEQVTVRQFLAEWLEISARPNVRPSTYKSYAGHVRMHINPAIGRIALAECPCGSTTVFFASEAAAKPQPLTQAIGRTLATRRDRPVASATAATSSTSL